MGLKARRFLLDDKDAQKLVESSGFLAHEVSEVGIPEAVIGEKDATDPQGNPEYQRLVYGRLITPLWSVVQDLVRRVGKLEKEG